MSIVGSSPKGALAAQCENSKTFMPYFRLLPHSLVESAKFLRVSTAGARPAPPPLRLLHVSGSSVTPAHSSPSGPHLAPPPAHAWGSAAKGAGQGRGKGGGRSRGKGGGGARAGSLCCCTECAQGPRASSYTVASFYFPHTSDIGQLSWLLSTLCILG